MPNLVLLLLRLNLRAKNIWIASWNKTTVLSIQLNAKQTAPSGLEVTDQCVFVYHQGSVLGKAGLHFITVCCPFCCYLPSHLKENLTTEKLGFVNGLILCLTEITGDIDDIWPSLWDPDHLT